MADNADKQLAQKIKQLAQQAAKMMVDPEADPEKIKQINQQIKQLRQQASRPPSSAAASAPPSSVAELEQQISQLSQQASQVMSDPHASEEQIKQAKQNIKRVSELNQLKQAVQAGKISPEQLSQPDVLSQVRQQQPVTPPAKSQPRQTTKFSTQYQLKQQVKQYLAGDPTVRQEALVEQLVEQPEVVEQLMSQPEAVAKLGPQLMPYLPDKLADQVFNQLSEEQQQTAVEQVIQTDPTRVAMLDLPGQGQASAQASRAYRTWSSRIESLEQADWQELQDDPQAMAVVKATYGYNSAAFEEMAHHLVEKYGTESGQPGSQDYTIHWQDPEAETAYQNLIEQRNIQKEWEEFNPQLAEKLAEYHQAQGTILSFTSDGQVPLLNPNPQSDEQPVMSYQQRIDQGSYFLQAGQTVQGYKQRMLDFSQKLPSHKFAGLFNAGNRLVAGPRAAVNKFKQLKNLATKLPRQLLAKAKRKIKAKIGKFLLKKGGKWLAGAVLSGGVATAVMIGAEVVRLLWKHKAKALAVVWYFYLMTLQLLQAIMSIAVSLIVGGLVAGLVLLIFGPAALAVAAVLGALAAVITYFTTHATPAEASAVAGEVAHSAAGSAASQATAAGQQGGLGQIFGSTTAVQKEILTLTTVTYLGGMGLAFFGAFFVMMHLLVAFSVPNPQETEFATGSRPGLPGSPGGSPATNPPFSDGMTNLINDAAAKACISADYMIAIMQTESGANLTDAQVQEYDTYDWWTDPSKTDGKQDCYQPPFGRSTTTAGCRTPAYCYDNGYDVWGITQFLTSTFYGCADPDGRIISSYNPTQYIPNLACRAGYVNDIIAMRGEDSNYVPNRCRVGDAIYAQAAFIGRRASEIPNSCQYDADKWDPANKKFLCELARSYCGSCGAIEADPSQKRDEEQPCKPWYLKPGDSGFASEGCGLPGNIGYCNLVYFEYVDQLSGG